MTTPRIEVDLGKISHNTRHLVDRLQSQKISVTGVTKAVCGHPSIAQAMLDGGAESLAEARISNVRRLRRAGLSCPITLIRTPSLSQVDQVVRYCDVSYNTETVAITALAEAAIRAGVTHDVILMVEMGDMREGILPENLTEIVQHVTQMPGVNLRGVAANFACMNGTRPDAVTMRALSNLATDTETTCGPFIESLSGGNSANLPWALGSGSTGRITNLRLGEAILLGVDPISGVQIEGLYTDAFTLFVEVIEVRTDTAFDDSAGLNPLHVSPAFFPSDRAIVALGLQDTDTSGLVFPEGMTCLGTTSDHMVVQSSMSQLRAGQEIELAMNYSALMRTMAAPDTTTVMNHEVKPLATGQTTKKGPFLELA